MLDYRSQPDFNPPAAERHFSPGAVVQGEFVDMQRKRNLRIQHLSEAQRWRLGPLAH